MNKIILDLGLKMKYNEKTKEKNLKDREELRITLSNKKEEYYENEKSLKEEIDRIKTTANERFE